MDARQGWMRVFVDHAASANVHAAQAAAIVKAYPGLIAGPKPLYVKLRRDMYAASRDLRDAASMNDSRGIADALRRGADLELPGDYARTALHLAAMHGYTGIVETLEAAGGDVNARDSFGYTPLFVASRYPDTVRVLLAKGAKPDIRSMDNETPLHRATLLGNLGSVKCLVDAGANTHALDASGSTPWKLAMSFGHADIIRYLS